MVRASGRLWEGQWEVRWPRRGEGPQERARGRVASQRGYGLVPASLPRPAAADFASMELSEVVGNAILSAYNGGLLNVNLSSPPAGEGPGPSGAATSPVLTSNDALLFHEKCGTLIKLSNNNKTAERRRPLDEFNNGVVMTNRPLRDNEMFEVCEIPGSGWHVTLRGLETGLDP